MASRSSQTSSRELTLNVKLYKQKKSPNLNITLINTSVQHFINHVKNCSYAEELIFKLKKPCLSSTTLNENLNQLQIMVFTTVNANKLQIDGNGK